MFPPISIPETYEASPTKALYLPIGAASPLWFMFAGATTAGLAYWWMTRWPTMATNLEAVLEPVVAPAIALPVPEPELAPPEILAEAVAEVIPTATVLEEPPMVEEPLAVEASPILDAVSEPEPEPKPAKVAKAKTPPTDDLPLAH